jgi:putative transcriptional regulator
MTINHHIDDDILLSYASGELDEGFSLLVAAHLSLCPVCRKTVELVEEMGGVFLEDLAPAAMSETGLADVMAAIDTSPAQIQPTRPAPYSGQPILPAPVRARFGGDVDAVRWKRIGPGVRQAILDGTEGGSSVRLLRITGGTGVLEHGHKGEEMTLVLAGGFKDGEQSFTRGDVEFGDSGIVHRPVADPGEDCICLAVTSAPLSFSSFIGRLAQPFARI